MRPKITLKAVERLETKTVFNVLVDDEDTQFLAYESFKNGTRKYYPFSETNGRIFQKHKSIRCIITTDNKNPDRWPTVRNRLIVAIADALPPKLLPRYQVDIEKRIYEVMGFNSLFVGRADVSVQQPRQIPDSLATATPTAITASPKFGG